MIESKNEHFILAGPFVNQMDSSLMYVLDNLLHAAATVQDESPADWRFFVAEKADGLFNAILVDFEIRFCQFSNWLAFVVGHHDIERNQIDVQPYCRGPVLRVRMSRLRSRLLQAENQ